MHSTLVNYFTATTNRTICGIGILMLLSFQTYGQEDWKLLKEASGVAVYYLVAECDAEGPSDGMLAESTTRQVIQLKIDNQRGEALTIAYPLTVKQSGNEDMKESSIATGTTVLSDCSQLPEISLTHESGDGLPISVSEYFQLFDVTIKE